VGLPTLASHRGEAKAEGADEPLRFVAWFVPNGVYGPAWTEDGSLALLETVRSRVDVIRGLDNQPASIDTAGHHAAGTAGFLTTRRARRSETHIEVGVSIDQRIAEHISGRALALGVEGGDGYGDCDNGFSCAYSRNISWVDPHRPRAKLVDPRMAFDELFAGFDPAATARETAARRARRRSVLDGVQAQAAALRAQLGADDRAQLDGHLEAVRELERRVEQPPLACPDAIRPDVPLDYVEHVEVMTDLIVLALQCDAARAVTFMLGNSASNQSFDFAGISGGHHDLSHHAEDPTKIEALCAIDAWHVEAFARLLARLAETPGEHGSLLDSTVVLFGSELSNGNLHHHDDLPILLAGGEASGKPAGRELVFDHRPLADLHLSLLHLFGIDDDRFGEDGDSPLTLV
jgi:hypothetical protein